MKRTESVKKRIALTKAFHQLVKHPACKDDKDLVHLAGLRTAFEEAFTAWSIAVWQDSRYCK